MNRQIILEPRPRSYEPRVIIFTTFNDAYKDLAHIALPNWKEYAEFHGYGLRCFPGNFHLDPTRVETYGDKIKFDLYYDTRGHCDFVMFLDIDALFMNFAHRVSDFIQPTTPFLWTWGDDGPLSGLWIARTDDVTEHHLRYAYEQAAIENNVRRGVIEPNGISDQDSMRRLMAVPPFSETFGNCVSAVGLGHCFPENYYPGAWIITFPGRSVEDKLALMADWAAR